MINYWHSSFIDLSNEILARVIFLLLTSKVFALLMLYYNFVCKTGGTIVLFDRKMLRNFRKDGHNWKKKNDGKTVKEAHEHLKVRISFPWCLFEFGVSSYSFKYSLMNKYPGGFNGFSCV